MKLAPDTLVVAITAPSVTEAIALAECANPGFKVFEVDVPGANGCGSVRWRCRLRAGRPGAKVPERPAPVDGLPMMR